MSKFISKIGFFSLTALCLINQTTAQTWQKQGATVLQNVVEGSACNTTRDTLAITTDKKLLLTCQAGVWARQGGVCGSTTVTYTVPGTYTVFIPAGCASARISACAGGGGGGAGGGPAVTPSLAYDGLNWGGGGGGLAGQCVSGQLFSSPGGGAQYQVIVGAGGAGGLKNTQYAPNGGDTALNNLTTNQTGIIYLSGGTGGAPVNTAYNTPDPFPGEPCVRELHSFPGQNSNFSGTGGGTAGINVAYCVDGSTIGGNGGDGTAYGAGGGGGGGGSSRWVGNIRGAGGKGGAGANGFVTISF